MIEGLDWDNSHRKIGGNKEGSAYMPVSVELVYHEDVEAVSVAHYFEQNGDLMRDPEIVFWKSSRETLQTCKADRWYPVHYIQDGFPPSYQHLIYFEDGRPERGMIKQQRTAATFCHTWFRNIRDQQKEWFEEQVKATA